jgi:hypothetical protein
MAAIRTASVHNPKNSASRSAGAMAATIARPQDWLEPMHKPAMQAATQKAPTEVPSAAIATITIQPTSVTASARRCPSQSWA